MKPNNYTYQSLAVIFSTMFLHSAGWRLCDTRVDGQGGKKIPSRLIFIDNKTYPI